MLQMKNKKQAHGNTIRTMKNGVKNIWILLILVMGVFGTSVLLYAEDRAIAISEQNTNQGRSPKTLIESIRQDLPTKAAEFIRQGMGITLKDEQGRTALIWASFRGHLGIVKQLLRKGVDLNARDYEGRNALMYGAMEGKGNVVEWLCQHGVNVNAQDNLGRTALMYASLYGQQNTVQILLDYGADPQVKNHKGMTALQLIQFKNNPQIEMLLQQLRLKQPRFSPARMKEDLQVRAPSLANTMRSLPKKQVQAKMLPPARPAAPSLPVKTPVLPMKRHENTTNGAKGDSLRQAAIEGDRPLIQQLIEGGAAIDHRDADGMTPLMWAARYGHTEMAKQLIELGADIHLKEYIFNWTPLMWAGRYGHVTTVKLLIAAGSDVQAIDKHGWTVLDLALSHYKKDIVKFLESQ